MFSLDLFCRVVDNYGDAGVCWRLARQLADEYAISVTLWIDQLATLQKICSSLRTGEDGPTLAGVTVRHWPEAFPAVSPDAVADVVIEGFGCRLPEPYLTAMAQKSPAPVWINMEYLSAEAWVNDCHQMASPQSSVPLIKHFFFPGFSPQTGGLLRETALLEARAAFDEDEKNAQTFLARLGVQKQSADCVFSLFCYADAPVTKLFDRFSRQEGRQLLCLVPEGVAAPAVSAFLGEPALPGARKKTGALTVQVIPLVDQEDYDRLLWSCDLNFVRGEDSFVRAQWAAKPFIWQVYPQEEAAHIAKLDAFLAHYLGEMPSGMGENVRGIWQEWNGITTSASGESVSSWGELLERLPEWQRYNVKWADKLGKMADFTTALVRFVKGMR